MMEDCYKVEWRDAWDGSRWEFGANNKPVAAGRGRSFATFAEAKAAAVVASDWAYAFEVDIRRGGCLVGGVVTNRKMFN